jgi:hypothetical protein
MERTAEKKVEWLK